MHTNKPNYNIAFMIPERRLDQSRVYIAQCKHLKFPATCKQGNFPYPSGFLTLLYYKKNVKHFSKLI